MTDTSFSGYWQTLTLCFHRFLFITCSLAALGDCGLLALQLLNTLSHFILRIPCAYALPIKLSICFWTMGYTFEHPYLLNTAHSPPPCSFFGKNSLLPFTPIFRFKMLLCSMNSTLVSPNTRIAEPILLSLDFSTESRTSTRPLLIICLSSCP